MNTSELLLECGKIMQLHGLSNAQWNGSVVSIDERSAANGDIRFVCEVIQGENKGKKLKVKESNLIEVPQLSPEKLSDMKEEFSKLREAFKEVQDAPRFGIKQRATIKRIYKKANDMIAEVPNCCMLWDFLTKICLFLIQLYYLLLYS